MYIYYNFTKKHLIIRTFSADFLLLTSERHSLLFDASELTATISTTPATSTANSGQEESPLPDSGTLDFYQENPALWDEGQKLNVFVPRI